MLLSVGAPQYTYFKCDGSLVRCREPVTGYSEPEEWNGEAWVRFNVATLILDGCEIDLERAEKFEKEITAHAKARSAARPAGPTQKRQRT